MGKRGLEPLRLAAHDPKSCSSANSDTSPDRKPANILAFCLSFCLTLSLLWNSPKGGTTCLAEKTQVEYNIVNAKVRRREAMPLRRCPHCKGLSNFSPGIPVHIRDSAEVVQLDICQNCGKPTYYRYPSEKRTDVILDAYPKLEREPDEELPEGVRMAFGEALKSLNGGIWNGCVAMCRRALEEAMQDLGAKGDSLFDQIDSLEVSHGITPALKERNGLANRD